jgi:hypothetical protein
LVGGQQLPRDAKTHKSDRSVVLFHVTGHRVARARVWLQLGSLELLDVVDDAVQNERIPPPNTELALECKALSSADK